MVFLGKLLIRTRLNFLLVNICRQGVILSKIFWVYLWVQPLSCIWVLLFFMASRESLIFNQLWIESG